MRCEPAGCNIDVGRSVGTSCGGRALAHRWEGQQGREPCDLRGVDRRRRKSEQNQVGRRGCPEGRQIECAGFRGALKHESRRKRYCTSKDSKKIEPLRRRLGAAPGAVGRLIIIFMPGDCTRAAYATHAVSAECGMMQHGLATSLHEHLPGWRARGSPRVACGCGCGACGVCGVPLWSLILYIGIYLPSPRQVPTAARCADAKPRSSGLRRRSTQTPARRWA